MAVSFNQIPSNIRVPLFYAEFDNSQAGTFQPEYKALLIGQKLPAGTAAPNIPLLVSRVDEAKVLFGQGSMLAKMMEVFRKNNRFTEVWCAALDDAGGSVAASGSVTIAGTATESGTLNVYVGGIRIRAIVTSGDTADVVGSALVTAATAIPDLCATAVNVNGVVTFTAKNKGALGNNIDIRVNYLGTLGGEATPAGLTVTVVAMASGSADPTLSNLIANMGDQAYDSIVCPYTDTANMNALMQELNDISGRWSWSRQVYGHVFSARPGTLGELGTFGNSRNDQHASVLGYRGSPSPPWEWAGAFGGVCSQSLGIDPARPLQTLPLNGVLLPSITEYFNLQERNTLLYDGISTWSESGGLVRLERVITTYQKNAFNEPDASYLDATTPATLTLVVRRLRFRIESKFPRHKLANNGTTFAEGQAIVTPNTMRAEIVAEYSEMVSLGLVENIEAFKATLIVERNPTDPNRLDILFTPDLVNQLRIVGVKTQFRLQFQGATAAAA